MTGGIGIPRIHNAILQPVYVIVYYIADALGAYLINSRIYSVIACYLRGIVINHNMSNVGNYVDYLL